MKINGLTYCWILIMLVSSGCNHQVKKTPDTVQPPIPVKVQKVTKTSFRREITMSGHIEGNQTVRLGFMVAGRINFIALREGEKIGKGQLLASLDPESYQIAKELADIQVSQTEEEYNRLKAMYETKSISESDFSKISYGLQQAKAQQKIHAKNLAETRIFSPLNGVLIKKLCETGEITGVGIPQFVISDISTVKVNAFIPENELHFIHIHEVASVYISAIDSTYQGKVSEVGSVADPASRAFTIRIILSNRGLLIRPGMIAEVRIMPPDSDTVLAVPLEAVLSDFNNDNYLFVADPSSGRAFKRKVSPGRTYQDQIEVVSGIRENELIVTGGQHKLSDGSFVTLQNE